jgi:uncharacterized membrane protein
VNLEGFEKVDVQRGLTVSIATFAVISSLGAVPAPSTTSSEDMHLSANPVIVSRLVVGPAVGITLLDHMSPLSAFQAASECSHISFFCTSGMGQCAEYSVGRQFVQWNT